MKIKNMRSFIDKSVRDIKAQVKDSKVILGLSGGVDSSVCAVLINKAIKKNLICVFVNHGLLRKGEDKKVKKIFKKHYKMNLRYVDARKIFLEKLKGVTDPEKKRKIIGATFIRVFEKEAKRLGNIKFLGQGTIYPDIIESNSRGKIVKTHHNVGGLPEKMGLELVEPVKYLFKDQVRKVGRALGMPKELILRQPFPGPGLGVRIIGDITEKRLDILRECDWRLIEEAKKQGIYYNIWQSFCVLLPVKTTGVKKGTRTYENAVAIRAVTSKNAMAAGWAKLPYQFLEKVSDKILREVKGVNRVVYDISKKPPATIEWE